MRLNLGIFSFLILISVTFGKVSVADQGVRIASLQPLVVYQDETIEREIASETAPLPENTDYLSDPQDKISADFKVPEQLRKRTAFWFDIYTKYGSTDHVIHHVLHPWIVFQVVDTSDIENKPGNRWAKYHKARKHVQAEKRKLVRALTKMSKMRNFKKLTAYQKEILAKLEDVPGRRKKVLREAAAQIRVQLGQRDFIAAGLESSGKYLSFMEKEFSAAGLPTELTRIPFVESSFNEKAESKVGASGIWQIMPRTGKEYLIVNSKIDERNSPLKASLAAIQILKSNHRQLKDWPLAITAYNHGAGGVKTALRKSKSTDLYQVIARYHKGSFKFASANFYSCFLAVLHAEKYHEKIFDQTSDDAPINPVVLKLKQSLRFKDLAKRLNIPSDTLLNYNYDLKAVSRTNGRLPKGYRVVLPADLHSELPTGKTSRFFQEAALDLPKARRI